MFTYPTTFLDATVWWTDNGLLNDLTNYYELDWDASDWVGSNDWTNTNWTRDAESWIGNGFSAYIDFSSNMLLESMQFVIEPDADISTWWGSNWIFSDILEPYWIRLGSVTGNATNEVITVVDWGNNDVAYWDSSDVSVITSSWRNHVLLVRESWNSNYRLYFNWADKWLATTFGSPWQVNIQRFWAYRNNPYFDWRIKKVAFWDKELTQADATNLYNGGSFLSLGDFTL